MELHKDIKTFHAKTRKDWRRWLENYYDREKCVWLIIYHKKSSTPCVTYADAVEEALCFGWIDSVVNKRDDESAYQFFTSRKPKSTWSKINRERAERLIKAGLMRESGQKMIDLAKASGTWDALTDVENNIIPADLQRRLDRNKKALRNFLSFSPSAQRGILTWIMAAKRPETREKRIRETVDLAAKNIKANNYQTAK